jgi:hypothetical protein
MLVTALNQRPFSRQFRCVGPGYFLADSDHVVGTVVTLGNDLGWQPAGASGPFVLYPVRS